jgi:hypothetical protein
MTDLPGGSLSAVLDSWLRSGWADGMVTVDRRLRLGPPQGDADAGWTIEGRLRRLTRWHWVPVVVEVVPMYGRWTKLSMTPQVRVFASTRYFRIGHIALDRLTRRLAEVVA